jgi:hypothetical protein
VHKSLARRPLRRRICALVAAYAIALSSLVASFAAARAAAEAAAQPGGVICHTVVSGERAPVGNENSDKFCVDNCCVGCLALLAALPPLVQVTREILSSSHAVTLIAVVGLASRPGTKFHQSRAPPQMA